MGFHKMETCIENLCNWLPSIYDCCLEVDKLFWVLSVCRLFSLNVSLKNTKVHVSLQVRRKHNSKPKGKSWREKVSKKFDQNKADVLAG